MSGVTAISPGSEVLLTFQLPEETCSGKASCRLNSSCSGISGLCKFIPWHCHLVQHGARAAQVSQTRDTGWPVVNPPHRARSVGSKGMSSSWLTAHSARMKMTIASPFSAALLLYSRAISARPRPVRPVRLQTSTDLPTLLPGKHSCTQP